MQSSCTMKHLSIQTRTSRISMLYMTSLRNTGPKFMETRFPGSSYYVQDIIMFHQFLVGKLLEDYIDEPYTINRWELDQAKCIIEQEDHAGAKNGSTVGTAYLVHVIYPLEEIHGPRDVSERGSDIQIRCLVTLCHNVVDIRCRRISSDVESI
jgi:hypothetical protein